MGRVIGAGVLEIASVPTMADYTAPTSTEINAGTFLTTFLTDGGLSTPFDGSVVDAADMSSRFNKTQKGTFGGNPVTLEFFRDDTTDSAWDAFPRDTVTNLVIARFGISTPSEPGPPAVAIADVVDVWQVEVITRNPADVVRNELQRFTVELSVTSVPAEGYALAA